MHFGGLNLQKGFYFSLELIIAFIFLALLFSQNIQNNDFLLNEVLVLQKQNDLLKIWTLQKETRPDTMAYDYQVIFPDRKALIYINGTKLEINGNGSKAIASEISFYNSNGLKTKIKLINYA